MRILALADEESPFLWDYFTPDRLKGVDLILSCGDLSPQYLSFLATYSHAPILYVHGNHDGCYKKTPPRAVSASRTESMCTTTSACWGWAAPCGTSRGSTSSRSAR